ncbi:MAG: hypothetical protein JO306_12610, partial [Gemmatimonadetes bacterium]|nr:hypothetical protein [Gemmatimonadota bacterium]
MPLVKYRAEHPNLRPRRTKLEVPGWAGQPEPRQDGSHEHPWHCVPFSEYARAGLEIPYPHGHELRVSVQEGAFRFDGAFDDEHVPPFRPFGREYYTYQLLLDLKVDAGLAIKVETHPRFFTDTTGTVPVAVPAILRHWWPMIYFVVFKAPGEGRVDIFRPGEPMFAVTIVRPDDKLELMEMPEEEAAERELISRRIYASRATLGADSEWTSATDTVFDGTYRRLFGAAKS